MSARLASIEAELAQVGEDSIAAEIELAMQPEATDLGGDAEDWCRALRAVYDDDECLRTRFLRRVIIRIDVPSTGPMVVHHRLIAPRANQQAPDLLVEGQGSCDTPEWWASQGVVQTLVEAP